MLRLFSARTSRRPAPLSRRVRNTAIAGAAMACLWGAAPQEAQAVPPNAQEFTISYFIIEPDGISRGPQLVARDFQTQFNLARCHCGDKIRVLIQRRRGQPWDPGIMEIRVGRQCDRGAQLNNGGAANYRPCLLLDRLMNPQGTFLTDVEFDIPIYWFSSGLLDVNHQSLRDPEARPHRFCPQITGSPGIWMCFGQDACQEGNFFLKPSVSAPQNPASSGSGTAKQGAQQNITSPMLDLVAPDSATDLEPQVNPGDGTVQITWNLPSDGNVVGYRVLCRPANPAQAGWRHPEGTRAIETFPGDRERFKTSTIYQLPQYLGVQCNPPEGMTPEGPQGAPRGERQRPRHRPEQNGGDSTQAQLATFEALQLTSTTSTEAGQSSMPTGSGPGVTSMPDSATSPGTTAGTSSGTSSETGSGNKDDGPDIDPAFQGMDWGYLCSDHLPGSTRSARVEGLTNETPYLFQLVAYDLAGNPALVGDTVEGTPLATVDYWDACNEGNVAKCGKLGFCAVSDRSPPLFLWGLPLLILGLRKRKEQPCR